MKPGLILKCLVVFVVFCALRDPFLAEQKMVTKPTKNTQRK